MIHFCLRRVSSRKGQAVVEFVLLLSMFTLIMMSLSLALNKGFGTAVKKYLAVYDFNPFNKPTFSRFSY